LHELTPECVELFRNYTPNICCQMPFEEIDEDKIYKKCKKKPDDKCCFADTALEISGVYVKGKFNSAKLLKSFEFEFEDGIMEGKSNWMPVIKESIETCEKMSKLL
jgi:hypothetical protein